MKTHISFDNAENDKELANVVSFVNTLDDTKKEQLARLILKGLDFFGLIYFGDEEIKSKFNEQFGDYVKSGEYRGLTDNDMLLIRDRCVFHEANTYDLCDSDVDDIIADYANERMKSGSFVPPCPF